MGEAYCPTNSSLSACCYNYILDAAGECIECPRGTYGVNCSSQCPRGYYGLFCMNECECTGDEICLIDRGCTFIDINGDETKAPEPSGGDTFTLIAIVIVLCLVLIIVTIIHQRDRIKCIRKECPKNERQTDENICSTVDQPMAEQFAFQYSDYADIRESRVLPNDMLMCHNVQTCDNNRHTVINHLWDSTLGRNISEYDVADSDRYQTVSFSAAPLYGRTSNQSFPDVSDEGYGKLCMN